MGFDEVLAKQVLESQGYNFSKALDVLTGEESKLEHKVPKSKPTKVKP